MNPNYINNNPINNTENVKTFTRNNYGGRVTGTIAVARTFKNNNYGGKVSGGKVNTRGFTVSNNA
jgi:hypothetical protein